ncbi:MAG: quinone-dependent dihydroorotate dehydrogenase [Burkholderiaceae bacterium]|nr:quinone-dependent dihydroorotate dehydrogenase [Burkholderiaceae bacterium]
MAWFPYGLARPFLFSLDAETAHALTVGLLARGQGGPLQCAWTQPRVQDAVTLAGLRFPNRVGLAAGLDKNGCCVDAFAAMGFGFIEAGTVTPLPQPGNPGPRLFRLPARRALINRMGFNNDGLQAFLHAIAKSRLYGQLRAPATADAASPQPPRPLLGLNIGKNAATPMERAMDDYLTALDGVYPLADYVAVNVSSPNTRNLRDLQSDAALDALLSALQARRQALAGQHRRQVPLFLKIAPDLDAAQVAAIASALQRHGMDGVIATNTTLARDAVQGLPHADEAGGLSGSPLLEASNRVIAGLRAALGPRFPIIGAGGVLSGQDAASKLQAGADVVQIYTGLIYRGPALVREAALALKGEAARRQQQATQKTAP